MICNETDGARKFRRLRYYRPTFFDDLTPFGMASDRIIDAAAPRMTEYLVAATPVHTGR